MKNRKKLLILCFITLISLILSWMLQTSMGKIKIKDFSFVNTEGHTLSGRIYIPDNVTAKNPGTAVITCAGGNSDFTMMRNINVFLANKGYVVITYSSYKHGDSDIAETETMGADEMIHYVHTLQFVDQDNIALIGHTRGSAYLMKAQIKTGGVRAIINLDTIQLLDSLKGYDADSPVSCGWIMSNYNEFLPEPGNYGLNADLQKMFGNKNEIKENCIYGSAEENTMRVLYTVNTIDAAYPFSMGYIQCINDFLGKALSLPEAVTGIGQIAIWPVLELLSMITFVGVIWILKELAHIVVEKSKGKMENFNLITASWCTTKYALKTHLFNGVIILLSFMPLYMLGKKILAPNIIFPQNDTNGLALWAVFTGLIYLFVIFLVEKVKHSDFSCFDVMYVENKASIGCYFLKALFIIVVFYIINFIFQYTSGIEIGVFNTKFFILNGRKLIAVAIYYPVFLFYFLFSSTFQVRFLYIKTGRKVNPYVQGILFHTMGIVLLYLINYIGFLCIGHSLFYWSRFAFGPILTIIPLLPVIGYFSTWGYEHTGKIYFGAFLNTFMFVWLLVGTNAFYYA